MSPFATALASTQIPWIAGGPVAWATPLVPVLSQTVNSWCWLATAASVDLHYGGTATQCDLADRLLAPQASCCVNPYTVACNRTGRVDTALQALQPQPRYHCTTLLNGPAPPLADVQNALGHAPPRPPIAQIAIPGGGNHVVLLAAHGTDGAGDAIVKVGDPASGYNPTDLVWSQAHRYRGGTTWTHIFWTQP